MNIANKLVKGNKKKKNWISDFYPTRIIIVKRIKKKILN